MPEEKKIEIGIPSIGIPGEILFNPLLTSREKILFGFLRNLSQSKNGCTAGNDYLANLVDAKNQTVINAIAKLKSYYYIIVQYEENKYTNKKIRHIYINPEYPMIYKGFKQEAHEHYIKNNGNKIKNFMDHIKFLIKNPKNCMQLNKEINTKYDIKDDTKKESVILKNNNIDKPAVCQTNPLMDYWNSLDNVKKHENPNTKTYQKGVKALRSLRAGTFYRKNPVDPKFLLKHRLPIPRNRKFTNDEIKTAMKNLSLLLTGGYGYSNGNRFSWPDDSLRTRLRALSFVDLLWHPKTNKSFFLLVLYNPPQSLKESEVTIPFDSEYYENMQLLVDSKYRPLDSYKKKQLIYRIQKMLEFQENLLRKHVSLQNDFGFQQKIGYVDDPTHFLETYAGWMTNNVDILISVKMIGPDGFCWPDFCQYLKTECYCQNL